MALTFFPQTLDEHEAHFRAHGYTILPDAVSPDLLAALQFATENGHDNPRLAPSGGRNLLAIDPVFEPLIDTHAGIPLLRRLIPDLQLLAMDMRACPPGGGAMGWHADIGFFSDQAIVSINTALYLDDLTPENGALRVLPRSHRIPFDLSQKEQNADLPGEVLVECPAGTMVLFQDTLWHRTGTNRTDHHRRGIFSYYGRHWMRPCFYDANPRTYREMPEYWAGKGKERAEILGIHRVGSEFNRPGSAADFGRAG